MVKQRKKIKYAVEYIDRPYGKKSKMLRKNVEWVTDLNDAKKWKNILEKDSNVLSITIKKLPKKEWF